PRPSSPTARSSGSASRSSSGWRRGGSCVRWQSASPATTSWTAPSSEALLLAPAGFFTVWFVTTSGTDCSSSGPCPAPGRQRTARPPNPSRRRPAADAKPRGMAAMGLYQRLVRDVFYPLARWRSGDGAELAYLREYEQTQLLPPDALRELQLAR